MPEDGKVVIVHTLKEAVQALQIAAAIDRPVTLQNAPGSLRYAGSLYLRELFMQALAAVPQARASYILDCGDEAALAAGALADGHPALRLALAPGMLDKLADIARQHGAIMYGQSAPALELRHLRNPEEALAEWLAPTHRNGLQNGQVSD